MAVRIQVILTEEEAAEFKNQAVKESKSLSSWLKEAAKKRLKEVRVKLRSSKQLALFFEECDKREMGSEPEWEEHKRMIAQGKGAFL
ncbi:MAG: hypothetical protein HYW48_02790 [Deltaproteobacteria bacterium]|nr:hypothetical protein [Deltaproteobacteria bacterium]